MSTLLTRFLRWRWPLPEFTALAEWTCAQGDILLYRVAPDYPQITLAVRHEKRVMYASYPARDERRARHDAEVIAAIAGATRLDNDS